MLLCFKSFLFFGFVAVQSKIVSKLGKILDLIKESDLCFIL